MSFYGEFKIKAADVLLSERGLQQMGPIQKFVDQECIRRMAEYTPFVTGATEKSATAGTIIGSGEINQIAPNARYLYYGKLMVSPTTGSSWAKKGEKKVLTERDLKYSKAGHPKAGPMWFERMKTDCADEILEGARKVARRL